MRVAWVTDIHLNFLKERQIQAFCSELLKAKPEVVLASGDLTEAPQLEEHLELLAAKLQVPVHFVLGNHDYYRSSISAVRRRAGELCARNPALRFLTQSPAFALTARTGIVGHDGWADGRFGDYQGSQIFLNDYRLIEELSALDATERRRRLEALGDEAAAHLARELPGALERFEKVLVVTHVPPFREACWHEGQISGDEWLPHFSCRATGEAIHAAAAARPDRKVVVLCGHTHGSGRTLPLPNLEVLTGGAEYGEPELQQLLVVD